MVEEKRQFECMVRIFVEEGLNGRWEMIMVSKCLQSWTRDKNMRNSYLRIFTEEAARKF